MFGFLNGNVVFMSKTDVRVPHIGWNALEWNETGGFAPVEPSYVYYDHPITESGWIQRI